MVYLKTKVRTCLIAPVLILLVNVSVANEKDEADKWSLSRYAYSLICTSEKEFQGDEITVERFIILNPSEIETMRSLPPFLFPVQQAGGAISLLNKHSRPEKTQFFYESYQLNSSGLIKHGHVTLGETASSNLVSLKDTERSQTTCASINRSLAPDLKTGGFEENAGTRVGIGKRWAIQGTEKALASGGAKLLDVGANTTLVMMLAQDRATGYAYVYDPLYRIETIAAWNESFWSYIRPLGHRLGRGAFAAVCIVGGLRMERLARDSDDQKLLHYSALTVITGIKLLRYLFLDIYCSQPVERNHELIHLISYYKQNEETEIE